VDEISLAERRKRRACYLEACFATWSILPPDQWAQTVRRMPAKHGASRPFSFDYAPYQRKMFDALFDRRNQETVFQLYSRGGKSEVVLNAVGYWIDEDPSDMFVMWPTLGQGKKWSKDQLMRELIDPTPELHAKIGDGTGRRKSDNTLLHKIYAGGLIDIVGANSPGDIRRAKGNRLYADEIDAIVEIESDEGDQLKQFKGRGDEFPDTREVYCSYPSLKGKSRIEAKLLKTDYNEWWVTCEICGGEPFIMHRSQIVYEPARPQDARLRCPRCADLLTDHQRYTMSRAGEWRPRYEFIGKKGFHANALLWPHAVDEVKYPGGFLQLVAQEEIDVETSDNPERSRRVMVNRRDAETYQSAGDAKPEHSALFLRREEYDPAQLLPAGVLLIVFFVDVQFDRLELFIEGHGENQQVWALDYQVIKGGKGAPLVKPDQGVWAELDRILLSTSYAHPSGKILRPAGGLVDAGNWRDHVFDFTRPRARRKIHASRGDTELSRPLVERRARREGKHKTPVWVLGTNAAKEVIYQRLAQDNLQSTGYRHYPALGQFSEQFFKMLLAENSEDRQGRDGQWHKWFGCEQGVRNESLDGAVGCMAAEKILKPKYALLAVELRVPEPGEKAGKPAPSPAASEKPVGKPAPRRGFVTQGVKRVGGFVGGWKR
jgi:phage terminase large subunit GpA-like protein